jgi:hypothetical protein
MTEHPVRRVLKRDLFPYLVTGRRLHRQWFYRLHRIFGYTTDFVVALSTVGVSAPLLAMLGPAGQASSGGGASPSMSAVLQSVPSWLMVPTALGLILWLFLRVAFNREDGQRRAVLAINCHKMLRKAEASLPAILATPDPMPEITKLLEKSIRNPVDQCVFDEAWPWLPFAPDIEVEVNREVDAWCAKFEADWTPVMRSHALQQRV